MEFQFKALEWKRLTLADRAHRCRLMAHEAMNMADSATPDVKERYFTIAEAFLRLAADLDAKTE